MRETGNASVKGKQYVNVRCNDKAELDRIAAARGIKLTSLVSLLAYSWRRMSKPQQTRLIEEWGVRKAK